MYLAILLLWGCTEQIKMPEKRCPGKNSVNASLKALRAHLKNVTSIKGHGQCTIRYQVDKKKKKENFPAKLWAEPPGRIYLQGDVAFDAKGIILGANKSEFWFWLRPKEISGYWWGKWSGDNRTLNLAVSPQILLEVLGLAGLEDNEQWSLTNEPPFDILTKVDAAGKIVKKIYVYCCDYRPRRIQYFDKNEKITAAVELGGYKEVDEKFQIPYMIDITDETEHSDLEKINIRLSAVKPTQLNRKQQEILFTRPPSEKFENVYQIINGRVIEQP